MNTVVFIVCIGVWTCSPAHKFYPVDSKPESVIEARELCIKYAEAIKPQKNASRCVADSEEIKK